MKSESVESIRVQFYHWRGCICYSGTFTYWATHYYKLNRVLTDFFQQRIKTDGTMTLIALYYNSKYWNRMRKIEVASNPESIPETNFSTFCRSMNHECKEGAEDEFKPSARVILL